MATLQKFFLGLAIAVSLSGCASAQKDMGYKDYTSPDDWAAKTMSGPFLPLAKEADVWSETKTFKMDGGDVGVQSKFLQQQGTTCTFEVKFTNTGTSRLSQGVALASSELAKSEDAKVFSHRVTPVAVDPGKAVWYEMEKRECPLKWGTSKEMAKCAECSPALVFIR